MRFGALFFRGDSFLTIFFISSIVIGQHDGQNSEMAPKFPPRGTQVLVLSLPFECRKVCDCDGFHICDLGEGDLMTKVKGFCRYNYGPNLVDFELIRRDVILGGSDLTSESKKGTLPFLKAEV